MNAGMVMCWGLTARLGAQAVRVFCLNMSTLGSDANELGFGPFHRAQAIILMNQYCNIFNSAAPVLSVSLSVLDERETIVCMDDLGRYQTHA